MSEVDKKESFEELKLLLEDFKFKLNLANKALIKSENECKNLKKYNSDLIKQIDFTNSKLNVLLKVCDSSKPEKEVQTKVTFNGSEKICPFCLNQLSVVQSSLISNLGSRKKLSDEIKEWANDALKACDTQSYKNFIYDPRSKTYYNPFTGWYYYPERKFYFDPKSNNFYQYDEEKKSFQIYPVIEKKPKLFIKSTVAVNEKQKLDKNLVEKSKNVDENEDEDGEIRSPDQAKNDNFDFLSVKDQFDNQNDNRNNQNEKIITISDHPDSDCELGLDYSSKAELETSCLRIIVHKSTTLEEGSLLLVTCKGALIGKDAECDVQILDELVSRKHAKVIYDKQLETYFIKDLESKNGIYINGKKMEPNQEFLRLNHDDILTLGECELLLHFHKGRNVTCLNCEPGCVQAALKLNVKPIYESISSEKERKVKLKQLKKKYGISFYEDFKISNSIYSDRADKRRKLKGSDNPYEKTAEGTALHKSLDDGNKGFKLLKKLGWSQGQGLGKEAKGDTEPLPIDLLENRVGLGYTNS